ncbi:MAG: hypothetical protein KA419_09865 [Acidobacteria bacterium]|nr:hypothetical protein [Acidobacteriota bacterium]
MYRRFNPALKAVLGLALLLALAGSALGYSDYYFPQAVSGYVSPTTYMTRFTLTNTKNALNTVTIKFYKDNGTAWSVQLDSPDRNDIDGTHSTFTFTLSGRETVTLKTIAGGSGLAVGWAHVQGQYPLTTSVGFTTYHEAGIDAVIDGDVGVPSSPAGAGFNMAVTVGLFEPLVVSNTDCGLAIANPNGRTANVHLLLMNRTGDSQGTADVAIPPKGHYSRFVTEIFPTVDFGNAFRGHLLLTSDTDVAPVALRMSHNILSTLPLEFENADGYSHFQKQEPNNDATHANLIHMLPAELNGSLKCPAGEEVDYYRIALSGGKTFVITPLCKNIGCYDELTVELRFADGNALLVSHTASTSRDPEPIVWTTPAGGAEYNVVVRGTPSVYSNSQYRIHIDAF